MTLLKTAKELFLDTLDRLRIADVMRAGVRHQSERLHIGELAYDLQDYDRVVVIAIGKAVTPMWETLLPALELALKQSQTIEAVVVGTAKPQKKDPRVQFSLGSLEIT
jgi:glycerate-2-kinase